MGKVFIIDDKNDRVEQYSNLLKKQGIDVFATNNVYKMTKYSKELQPDLYVVDADVKDPDYRMLIEYLIKNFKTPLTVVCNNIEDAWHDGVSHYVLRPMVTKKLGEVAGAYCHGGKKYDFLLLNQKKKVGMALVKEKSLLNVHNVMAAKLFLQKNNVEALGVYCNPEKYSKLRDRLGFAKTFYVEKIAKNGDLKTILK